MGIRNCVRMIKIPPYFLARPPLPTDAETLAAFERLFAEAIAYGPEKPVDYTLSAPRWQFLCWLADNKEVVLHGSGNPDIAQFEPRKANDVSAFGDREAVYAASDGLWPMYFAMLDRAQYPMTLINGCFRLAETPEQTWGQGSEPLYFFSITREALERKPYRRGTVYLLPRDTFERQPAEDNNGAAIHIPQWASLQPVAPLAKIAVGPEDFPFLSQLRGHDDKAAFERAAANPGGFPWIEEQ